jgi:hypothetical protein
LYIAHHNNVPTMSAFGGKADIATGQPEGEFQHHTLGRLRENVSISGTTAVPEGKYKSRLESSDALILINDKIATV